MLESGPRKWKEGVGNPDTFPGKIFPFMNYARIWFKFIVLIISRPYIQIKLLYFPLPL